METLKIKWNKKACSSLEKIATWYLINMGENAALKFITGIDSTVQSLSHSPGMGIEEPFFYKKHKYRSFLAYPHYRILYRYTKSTLTIVDIICTRMNDSR